MVSQLPDRTNSVVTPSHELSTFDDQSSNEVQEFRPTSSEAVPVPQAQKRKSTLTSIFKKSSNTVNESGEKLNFARTLNGEAPNMDASVGVQPNEEEVLSLLIDDSDSDSEPNDNSDDLDGPQGETKGDKLTKTNTLSKVSSAAQKLDAKFRYFDEEFKEARVKIALLHTSGNLLLMMIIMGIFSLFWGAMYQRESRLKNFEFAVVRDDPTIYTETGIPDVFSDTLMTAINISSIKPLAGWMPRYYTNYTSNTSELFDKFHKDVYHQTYWAIVWVKPNASLDYYNALQNGEAYNVSDVYHCMYETGRHMSGVSSFLSKGIQYLGAAISQLQPKTIVAPFSQTLNDTQLMAAMKQNFIIPITLNTHDVTPTSLSKPIAMGPQQFGPIYLHLLSLMQLAYFIPYHGKIASKLNNKDFLIFRLCSQQFTYLLIGLTYTLVQIAFKINIYTAYPGKSGFVVFWIFTYLVLAALGGVNENVAILLKAYAPNMVPSWMFLWMALNIAPTTFPLNLSPKFYRFAYAMPIFNGYETYKILLFNTWKQASLARNVVVLIAYVVISIILNPFCLKLLVRKLTEEAKEKAKQLKLEKKEMMRSKVDEKGVV